MILRTENLKEKGLTQEQIDYIMTEVGKGVNALTAERDTYKSQLDTAKATLKSMEGVDVAGLQGKVNTLTQQLSDKNGEIEKIKSDYAFDSALKEAIRAASGRSEKAITAMLDVDTLKASKNQEKDIKTAIEALKKDNGYLFQDVQIPRVVATTPGPGGSRTDDTRTRANDALRSILGRE